MTVKHDQQFYDPAESARFVADFISVWCNENYSPEFCAADKHVILKSLSRQIQKSMIEAVGDISEYWAVMLAALQHWFPPDDSIYEVRVFRGMIDCSGGMFGDQESELAERFHTVYQEYRHWLGKPLKDVPTH